MSLMYYHVYLPRSILFYFSHTHYCIQSFWLDMEEDQAPQSHYPAGYYLFMVYSGHLVWIRLLSIYWMALEGSNDAWRHWPSLLLHQIPRRLAYRIGCEYACGKHACCCAAFDCSLSIDIDEYAHLASKTKGTAILNFLSAVLRKDCIWYSHTSHKCVLALLLLRHEGWSGGIEVKTLCDIKIVGVNRRYSQPY